MPRRAGRNVKTTKRRKPAPEEAERFIAAIRSLGNYLQVTVEAQRGFLYVHADEVDTFIQRVPESVIILIDEAYFEMVDSDSFPKSLAYVREGRKNVFVLRTFSKVYGLAGIRIGYGFADPDVVSTLFKIKPPFNVNVLAQAAGIAALQDSDFVTQSVDANKIERQHLYRELDKLGLSYAESHTNFILIRIGSNASNVQKGLLERGVIVRPCGGYDLPEFLRVSIGTPAQNERFIKTLSEVLGS